MSMLIIGENPPKSCYACSWYNKVECPVNDGRYYYRAQRHPSCPLVELPPHGRLGDLDALIKDLAVYRGGHNEGYGFDGGMYEAYNNSIELVEEAPTVIEAEGSEE